MHKQAIYYINYISTTQAKHPKTETFNKCQQNIAKNRWDDLHAVYKEYVAYSRIKMAHM